MKNVLNIINTKPSDLEFEVNIDGFEPKKVDVCLCVKTKDYYLKFPCKKNKSNWECHIPALSHLEKGAYPYVIEVVADGYHFEATSGTANLAGSFDIYAKKPDKLVPGKEDKKEEKPVEKKEVKNPVEKKVEAPTKKPELKKTTKKEAVDLADKKFTELVDNIISKKEPSSQKKEEKPLVENKKVENKKDDAIKKIVSESKKVVVAKEFDKKEEVKNPIFKKVASTVQNKEKATIVVNTSGKVKDDVIKKIVSESKNTPVKVPTIPMRKTEEKSEPIIQKKDEPNKEVIKEEAELPKNERDDNIKNILKNLSNQKVLEEVGTGNVSPLFKKGKRIVH